MRLRYFGADIESDDRALLQYESLRSQVVDKQGALYERNLGLALFIRQGMLAWIESCQRCMPAHSTLDKQREPAVFPYEANSEMIKVLANITLLNLRGAQP
jgi:hypothetical protein